jgi:YidC/Oxa1 family membrane protein insertase
MLLASNPISSIAQPLFNAFAQVLAFFYSLVPNYAVAIALLTVAVMIVVFPITRRGTRSMMRMQIYQPELKKLAQRYKAPQGATAAEKAELRQRQQEEMMAFYKENNISPTGGCLPMFLQLPIFWILYGTIRGLVHTTTKVVHGAKLVVADPLYISHTSKLYRAIAVANPHPAKNGIRLDAFGLNLADSVRTGGLSWAAKAPYIVMILIAVGLQYVQMKQLSGRNPAQQQANPQMAQMQKVFPIIFAVIYIAIPAGVNVYFIVSSLFRIGQQEFMYRRDPQLQESLRQLRERHAKAQLKTPAPRPGGAGGARLSRVGSGSDGERPRGLLRRLGIANPLSDAATATGTGMSGDRPAGPNRPRPATGRQGAPSSGADRGDVTANGGDPTPAAPRRGGSPGGRARGGQQASVPPPKVAGTPLARQRPAAPNGAGQAKPRTQPRAQGKRARRPR